MSLQVWLPLNGDLNNQGLNGAAAITTNSATVNTNGKIGSCYLFDGTSNYMQFSNFNMDNLLGFSIACWLKPVTDSVGGLFLVRSGSTHRIRLDDSGLTFRDTKNSNQRSIPWNHTFIADKWVHICTVYKQGEVFIYCNGELTNHDTSYYHSNGQTNTSNTEIRIGRSQSTSGNVYFNGSINDFRIYDHALSAKEVKEISKGLILHYKLDNNGLGNSNLAPPSTNNTATTSSAELKTTTFSGWDNYATQNIALTSAQWNAMVGQQITYSMWMRNISQTTGTGTGIMIHFRYADGTYQQFGGGKNGSVGSYLAQGEEGLLKITVTIPDPTARSNPTTIDRVQYSIRHNSSNGVSTVEYKEAKIERGSKVTSWSPYIESNIVYDDSGYSNNGIIIGTYITNSLTPRYEVSTYFDGASAIKCESNKWMVQGTEQLTINFWAKAVTWPAKGGRVVSCTESGGWNLEGGSSGYWRFPVHVYTDAAKSATAYKYDSKEIKISNLIANEWNMITLVYDATQGTKTYINGELHHTYNNVSYGIHYNTNVRLHLGCEAASSPTTPYFVGQESDFRIYATVLSAEDIKELYNTSASIDNKGNVYAREVIEI